MVTEEMWANIYSRVQGLKLTLCQAACRHFWFICLLKRRHWLTLIISKCQIVSQINRSFTEMLRNRKYNISCWNVDMLTRQRDLQTFSQGWPVKHWAHVMSSPFQNHLRAFIYIYIAGLHCTLYKIVYRHQTVPMWVYCLFSGLLLGKMGERGAPLVNVCQCINECVMKIINAAMW